MSNNITITIHGANAEEVADHLRSLVAALSAGDTELHGSELDAALGARAEVAATAAVESTKPEPTKPEPAKAEVDTEPQVTRETVRAKLVALTQSGKQPQVKKLLESFGASKLSEVPEDKYPALLQAAEEVS